MSRLSPKRSTTPDKEDTESDHAYVKVYIRIRPLNKRELTDADIVIPWQYSQKQIRSTNTAHGASRSTTFDGVLGPETTQKMCYNNVASPLVVSCMNGYNGTIFAYGQTGSGKTWSMSGIQEFGNESAGIAVRTLETVFNYIENHPEREFLLRMAFIEIYNEEINDLLGASEAEKNQNQNTNKNKNTVPSWKNLKILRDDPVKGAVIENLTEVVVSSKLEALEVLVDGEKVRHVAGTTMNARSSRSHLMIRMCIESSGPSPDNNTNNASDNEQKEDPNAFKDLKAVQVKESLVTVSYLNLVDLAGSERQKNAETSGTRLKEGAAINRSLLNLGKVIAALSGAETTNTSPAASPKNSSPKNSLKKTASSSQLAKRMMDKKKSNRSMSKQHIPFRNSKLTRILKSSLGGNASTSVLLTMTGSPQYSEESMSTIKFGELCKKIKNRVRKNEDKTQTMLDKYRKEIEALRLELSARNTKQEENTIQLLKVTPKIIPTINVTVEEHPLEDHLEELEEERKKLESTKVQLKQEKKKHEEEHVRVEELKQRLLAMQTALFNSETNTNTNDKETNNDATRGRSCTDVSGASGSTSSTASVQPKKHRRQKPRRASIMITNNSFTSMRLTGNKTETIDSIHEEKEDTITHDITHDITHAITHSSSSSDSDNPLDSIDVTVRKRQVKRIHRLEKQLKTSKQTMKESIERMILENDKNVQDLLKTHQVMVNNLQLQYQDNDTLIQKKLFEIENERNALIVTSKEMEEEVMRLSHVLIKRELHLQEANNKVDEHGVVINTHKEEMQELKLVMHTLRQQHLENQNERKDMEQEQIRLTAYTEKIQQRLHEAQAINVQKEQKLKQERIRFDIETKKIIQRSNDRIESKENELQEKLIHMNRTQEKLRIQLLLNQNVPLLQRKIRLIKIHKLEEATQNFKRKLEQVENVHDREKKCVHQEKQLKESRLDVEKRKFNLQIVECELEEDIVASTIKVKSLNEKENLIVAREQRVLDRISVTQLERDKNIAMQIQLNVQSRELDLQQEEIIRKTRDMKYYQMTLDTKEQEQIDIQCKLKKQQEAIEIKIKQISFQEQDIESKKKVLMMNTNEMERKRKELIEFENQLEYHDLDLKLNQAKLKEKQLIALSYDEREENLKVRIIEQTERENAFFENHASKLQRTWKGRMQVMEATVEKQLLVIRRLRETLRGKLLEEQKNKKNKRNITNGGNNLHVANLHVARDALNKSRTAITTLIRDQKDMGEAQKERDDLYDGDSSSLRRGTYFGLYKKEDVAQMTEGIQKNTCRTTRNRNFKKSRKKMVEVTVTL